MSWLFSYFTGGSEAESRLAGPTDAERHRSQQIEGLRAAAPCVREVERDRHYRIETAVKGEPLLLDVFLPVDFPLSSPEIKLSRHLHHPWVHNLTLSECPSLRNFSIHSNLGVIISEVIRELNENSLLLLPTSSSSSSTYSSSSSSSWSPRLPPPSLSHPTSSSGSSSSASSGVMMTSPHSQSVLPSFHQPPPIGSYQPYYQYSSLPQPQPPSASASLAATPPQQPSTTAQPRQRSPRSSPKPKRKAPPPPRIERRGYTPPPVPVEFPAISDMSDVELKRFLDEKEGPVLVDHFVRNLNAVKKIQADRDLLFQETEDQAHINLGHEPELQNGWTRLQEKTFELMAERERYDRLTKEQQLFRDKHINMSKTAASRLKSLAQEIETDSEIMGEEFLENGTPKAEEFIRVFKEKRKLHHLRMSKYEKLQFSGRRH